MTITGIVVPERELAEGVPPAAPDDVHSGTLVMLRPMPSTAEGLAAARGVGAPLVALPDDADLARWMVSQVAGWLADGEEQLERTALGLSSLLPPAPGLPTRAWGDSGVAVPAVPRRMLARLCRLLWRPCPHCDGGGVPGGPCGRCRQPLERVA
ncbi:MAG: hypothetical protein U0Y82_07865 [Thermoleophilia bacterium]